MLLLLAAAAHAACVAEAPDLRVGERAWWVDGGAWEVGPTTLAFGRGYAFAVEAEGAEVGIVYVGKAEHIGHPDDVDAGALAASLRRELAVEPGIAGGVWTLPVDVVWALGSPAVALPGWSAIEMRDGAMYDVSQSTPALLVVSGIPLRAALATARGVVNGRPAALADAGYPLASVLRAGVPAWGMVEARTSLALGALAGRVGVQGAAPDPWIATFVDDIALDAGRRHVTVSLGTRYVESLTGG